MMRKRSSVPPARGFTLIEALVSVVVVTIGMLGLYSGYSVSVKANSKGRRVSQATEVAQGVLHELSLLAWDSAALANSETGNDDDVGDQARGFEKADTPTKKADHQLALYNVSLAAAANLVSLKAFKSSETLDLDGNGLPDFEVYWNVANCTVTSSGTTWSASCTGVSEADAVLKQLGVIVRWKEAAGVWQEVTAESSRATTSSAGL